MSPRTNRLLDPPHRQHLPCVSQPSSTNMIVQSEKKQPIAAKKSTKIEQMPGKYAGPCPNKYPKRSSTRLPLCLNVHLSMGNRTATWAHHTYPGARTGLWSLDIRNAKLELGLLEECHTSHAHIYRHTHRPLSTRQTSRGYRRTQKKLSSNVQRLPQILNLRCCGQ